MLVFEFFGESVKFGVIASNVIEIGLGMALIHFVLVSKHNINLLEVFMLRKSAGLPLSSFNMYSFSKIL